MVGSSKRQFGIVEGKIATLEVKEASRTTQIVKQMAVDMEKIGISAQSRNNVLVPDLGQHGTAGACQGTPPFDLSRQNDPPVAVLHGLLFRHQPTFIKA